jgi:hypothetical protein
MSLLSDFDVGRDSEASFEYMPLPLEHQAIRLLTLLPSSQGAKVQCMLTNHAWDVETGIVSPSSSGRTLDALVCITSYFIVSF